MTTANEIRQAVAKAARQLGINQPVQIDYPADPAHGDYASNLALLAFSQKRRQFSSPLALAQAISAKLSPLAGIAKIETAPPGFINFYLDPQYLWQTAKAAASNPRYGQQPKRKTTIMVEFGQPNTHKPLHLGHLRGLITGEALSRLLEANGYQVIRTNYQGDIGLHVAKALWGLEKLGLPRRGSSLADKIRRLGEAYRHGNQAYEEDIRARQEIQQINQNLYQQKAALLPRWRQTRRWSLAYFEQIYQRLDIHFDRLYFESEVFARAKEIVQQQRGRIFKPSQGALVFPGEKYGLHTRVFLTKQGWPTYEAKDLALAELQLNFHQPARVIHLVASEQEAYFRVVFKVLELIMPTSRGREVHRSYGLVRLKSGRMSSRQGQLVLAEDVLQQTRRALQKRYPLPAARAEIISQAAIKYSFLRLNPSAEIVFDPESAISLEGDSGPYLEYTLVRLKSLLRQKKPRLGRKPRLEANDDELALLRLIHQYPEIVAASAAKLNPQILAAYLYRLSRQFSLFYDRQRILQSPRENERLLLSAACRRILGHGLHLLGIAAVEKM